MIHFYLRKFLPKAIFVALFGDRAKYGFEPVSEDIDWKLWQDYYAEHYEYTQRQSVGRLVSDVGYSSILNVDLCGKRILEIGGGDLLHTNHWNGVPAHLTVADISQEMLSKTRDTLGRKVPSLPCETILLNHGEKTLPFYDCEFDVFFTFFTLEHLYPLDQYLKEILRVLKPGGIIVGAIPCEGGIAWGLGRYLTSRKRLLKNTKINPNKVVCWEHPNFSDEILENLDIFFEKVEQSFWPIRIPSIDLNLVAKFVFRKRL